MVGFAYRIELVPDGKYGVYDYETGEWNGIVRQLMDKVSVWIGKTHESRAFIRVNNWFELAIRQEHSLYLKHSKKNSIFLRNYDNYYKDQYVWFLKRNIDNRY